MPYPPHIFAANPLDRGDVQRRDPQWLADAAQNPDTRVLVMPELDVPITDDRDAPALNWLTPRDVRWFGVDGEPVFLGLLGGVPHFAVHVPATSGAAARLRNDDALRFIDARSAAPIVSGAESGIIAQARAQLDWHNRHGYCSVCGRPTEMGRGGHVRKCNDGCGAEHFPRTDPVAIMLVHDGDRCLLGQSRGTPRANENVLRPSRIHRPRRIHRRSRSPRSHGRSRNTGKKRPIPLIPTLALPVVIDDRLPRRSRHHRHPHRRRRNDRRPMVPPPTPS